MNFKHGRSGRNRDKAYFAWVSMRDRCNNHNNPRFDRYGGRGITVCARWDYFSNFIADIGLPPRNTSLERVDNDGNYDPKNCRWATSAEQARNRSDCRRLTHDGKTMVLQDWAKATGIKRGTIFTRLALGWSVKDALTKPVYRK